MAKKTCAICKEKFTGREDKKFCSANCRSAFNNRINKDETNYVRNVNNALRKNRRILKKINPNGKTKAHRDKLLDNGFNFTYHTNIYTTKSGNVYFYCYDQGYMEVDNDYFVLVEKKF